MKSRTFTSAIFAGLMPYRNSTVGNHEVELKLGVKSLIPNLIEAGYEVGDDKSLSGTPRLLKNHPLPVIPATP